MIEFLNSTTGLIVYIVALLLVGIPVGVVFYKLPYLIYDNGFEEML